MSAKSTVWSIQPVPFKAGLTSHFGPKLHFPLLRLLSELVGICPYRSETVETKIKVNLVLPFLGIGSK